MRSPTRLAGLALAVLATTLTALLPAPAAATSYNISTFADDAMANGNCTLREALRAADGNVAVDACAAGTGADAIVLPTGTYSFSGEEALGAPGKLIIMSATLNPFHVIVDLHGSGRFVALSGGGKYDISGLGTSGNYRLAASSPAIDAGTGSVVMFRPLDLDRRTRLMGLATDIGAYEYSP